MKNKYGFSYTPLTKVQRRVFEERLIKLDETLVKASDDHAANKICYAEYIAITQPAEAERAGIRSTLAILGWKYDSLAKCLVPRYMGYEDLVAYARIRAA